MIRRIPCLVLACIAAGLCCGPALAQNDGGERNDRGNRHQYGRHKVKKQKKSRPVKRQNDIEYFVRVTGSDSADGRSKETALRTIQKAIGKCAAGGGGYTIHVGPGTYNETLTIGEGAGAVSGTLAYPNCIFGDPTGVITGDEAGPVIVDGGGVRQHGLHLDGVDYWRFDDLVFEGQTSHNVLIQNSTGVELNDSELVVAASFGVYAYRAADLTISGNTMVRGAQSGHCVYISTDNRAGYVKIDANRLSLTGPAYLSRNYGGGTFNLLAGAGGSSASSYGIMAMIGNGTTRGTLEITNNVSGDCVIGVYAYANGPNCSAVIANNTVTGCVMPLVGYGYKTNDLSLVNNITTDSAYPYLAYAWSASGRQMDPVVVKGLLQHNIRYPDAWSAINSPATGVISADPKFTDAAEGDFSLKAGSPARDAGFADSAPALDVRGRTRPGDENSDGTPAFDLGAWEGGSKRNLRVLSWWEAAHDSESNGETPGRARPARSISTGTTLTDPTVRSLLELLGYETTGTTGTR